MTDQARYQGPDAESLNERQAQVLKEIERTRTTGRRGPFQVWLANAELADAAQKLGRICRYETSLSLRESEMLILQVATFHKSATEWNIHVEEARKAGVEEDIIEAIQSRRDIPERDAKEVTLNKFAVEVLHSSCASDVMYNMMKSHYSDQAIVEVVSIIGYYSYVAYTLNVFKI